MGIVKVDYWNIIKYVKTMVKHCATADVVVRMVSLEISVE